MNYSVGAQFCFMGEFPFNVWECHLKVCVCVSVISRCVLLCHQVCRHWGEMCRCGLDRSEHRRWAGWLPASVSTGTEYRHSHHSTSSLSTSSISTASLSTSSLYLINLYCITLPHHSLPHHSTSLLSTSSLYLITLYLVTTSLLSTSSLSLFHSLWFITH